MNEDHQILGIVFGNDHTNDQLKNCAKCFHEEQEKAKLDD